MEESRHDLSGVSQRSDSPILFDPVDLAVVRMPLSARNDLKEHLQISVDGLPARKGSVNEANSINNQMSD